MENVNNPKHYIGRYGLEVIDVVNQFICYIDDPYAAHLWANAIEYLLRAPRKNGNEDLQKALRNLKMLDHYLVMQLKDLKEENNV